MTVVAENGHHGAEDDSPIGETDKGGGERVTDAVGWCGGLGGVGGSGGRLYEFP